MEISTLAQAPVTAATTSATSQFTQNFDTFLTLLTTQLRNQDPLEPLDTEQFTEQLVQFSAVEQSIQTNTNLEALIALQSASANESALSMVGRIATVASDVAPLTSQSAQWQLTLGQTPSNATAQIIDSNGVVVANLEISATAGVNNVVWDGRADDGTQAPAGAYRLAVTAQDSAGNPLPADITTRGLVNAATFNAGAPQIEIGGQAFSLDSILRIDAS